MKEFIAKYWPWAAVLALVAVLFVPVPGCQTEDFLRMKEQVATLNTNLQEANTQIQDLAGIKSTLEAAIQQAQTTLENDPTLTQEQILAYQAKIAEYKQKLDEQVNPLLDQFTSTAGQIATQLDALNTAIQNADDPLDAAAATVQSGGTIISQATGNPIPGLVGMGVSALISWFASKRKAVAGIVKPIEAARMPQIEAELNKNGGNGDEFIVFSKWDASLGHQRSNLDELIRSVTSK